MPIFRAPDGTRLTYHLRGEGEPLVVLPGGPMRASAYLGNLGGLDAHRQLVLLDLRGTGESELPADRGTYRCDRLVDDVEALRLQLRLERMDVLAHSAGGSLAMLYAARHPQRLGRLALITATPWALACRRRPGPAGGGPAARVRTLVRGRVPAVRGMAGGQGRLRPGVPPVLLRAVGRLRPGPRRP